MPTVAMLNVLTEVRDHQLQLWPLAKENYKRLSSVERHKFMLGDFEGAVQFNPDRIISTGAKVDAGSIAKRKCFLCAGNRPPEQLSEEILPGWEFLINPYPILPLHFTIASVNHEPQAQIPVDAIAMAEKLPGMTVFYNGAKAGASAPDHLHCQAVMTSELPLMQYLEDGKDLSKLPFIVDYRVISPDDAGLIAMSEILNVKGIDKNTGRSSYELVNAYFWMGKDKYLRVAVIPRSAHRPECYPSSEGNENSNIKRLMVSPGAIDMAGIIVVPRLEDYQNITDEDIAKIYADVAIGNCQTASRL